MNSQDVLYIIPARGGSKGLPRKNVLPLLGKPMIYYTIDAARGVTSDEHICVSTDDLEIKAIVEDYGLKVPFLRPGELASDIAGSREVILHCIDFYKSVLNKNYERVCLLQPTSPLRKSLHIREAFYHWDDDLDMVVSVNESHSNPYFTLFEEHCDGFLIKSKRGDFKRRQDAPKIWEYNGAIYLFNVSSIQKQPISDFVKVRKYVMTKGDSVDVDDKLDFLLAEIIFKGLVEEKG